MPWGYCTVNLRFEILQAYNLSAEALKVFWSALSPCLKNSLEFCLRVGSVSSPLLRRFRSTMVPRIIYHFSCYLSSLWRASRINATGKKRQRNEILLNDDSWNLNQAWLRIPYIHSIQKHNDSDLMWTDNHKKKFFFVSLSGWKLAVSSHHKEDGEGEWESGKAKKYS